MPSFEIADGELNNGVFAVEPVGFDHGRGGVGDEGVVAPIGPQSPLGPLGEAGSTHNKAHGSLPAFGAAARP